MNGMEGGNYIPQSPAQTWEVRYGDCKAKTLMLLAMLRDLGIEAEATLVAATIGDTLPDLLPMPADFDHAIVRATIDGEDYWLDGTSSGASMAVVHEVPAFHHALPIRAGGADLMPMRQRPQQVHDLVSRMTIDSRAGLDLPALFDGSWTITGAAAGPFRAAIGLTGQKQMQEELRSYVINRIGDALVGDVAVTWSDTDRAATLSASGILLSGWEWDRGRGSRNISVPSAAFQFRPDRARAGWRDVPVRMTGPYWEQAELTMLLPSGEYTLAGKGSIAEEIATVRLNRETELGADRLVVRDSAAWPGGEIEAEEVAAYRQAASRFGQTSLTLRAPADAARRFDAGALANPERTTPLEDAFAQIMANDPDEVNAWRQRANFRASIADYAGAVEDIDHVISEEPDAAALLWRSALLEELGKLDAALDDAERAGELQPDLASTMQRATLLRYLDQADEAATLLLEFGGTEEEERQLAPLLSDLEGQLGRPAEGLDRLDALLADRPADPGLLNAACWHQAGWETRMEEMADACTRAVENAQWTPPVLDSRALAWLRLGRLDDALKDLNSALTMDPEQIDSVLLRGVVLRELGQVEEGRAEIGRALVVRPSLERYYALYGIKVR